MKSKARLEFDSYVLDSLMGDLVGHDRRPSAFLVYLTILTANSRGVRDLSYAQLAESTGLSRRSAQDAVTHLITRRLLRSERSSATETTHYTALTPWRR